MVRQHGGGFCHLGTATCWGPDQGLPALERRLARRIRERTGGSYTVRLAEDRECWRPTGPNHTLPTGGGARFGGGLSVMHFLRVRTWLQMHPGAAAAELARNAAALARLEGLEAHARAAKWRSEGDVGVRDTGSP